MVLTVLLVVVKAVGYVLAALVGMLIAAIVIGSGVGFASR